MTNSVCLLSEKGVKKGFQNFGVAAHLAKGKIPCDPGIYAILCTKNNCVFFGESENLYDCFQTHHLDFQGKKSRSSILKLEQDWNAYGENSFEWIVLEAGEEWTDSLKRQNFLEKLIQRYGSVVYNTVQRASILLQKQEERGNPTKQFHINGRVFQSIAELSTAFAISKKKAYSWLGDPTHEWPEPLFSEEEVAIQMAAKRKNSKAAGSNLRQRVSIYGVVYESVTEACQAIEKSRATILRWIKSYPEDFFYVDENNNRISLEHVKQKREEMIQPVEVKGIQYRSVTEAARVLNIQKRKIVDLCKAENQPQFRFLSRDESASLPKRFSEQKSGDHLRRRRAVLINGEAYPSLAQAAKAFETHPDSIRKACEDPLTPHFKFLDDNRLNPTNSPEMNSQERQKEL